MTKKSKKRLSRPVFSQCVEYERNTGHLDLLTKILQNTGVVAGSRKYDLGHANQTSKITKNLIENDVGINLVIISKKISFAICICVNHEGRRQF